MNRGGGRGWRNWFHATGLPGWKRFGQAAPEEASAASGENESLRAEVDQLKQRLNEMERRNS